MIRKSNILHTVLLLGLLVPGGFGCSSELQAQGRLSRIRDSVRRHDPPRPSHKQDDDDDNDHDHGSKRKKRGSPHRRGHVPRLSLNFLYNDCCPPHVVEHVHWYEPAPLVLAQSPAASSELVPGPPVVFESIGDSYFSCWSGRMRGFFGSDFNGLSQGTLGLLLQRPAGFGLDTSVTMFRESGVSFRDHLWIGDFNVVYEVINAGYFRARLGAGVNWLADWYGSEAGGNLTMGADWQISPKWMLTGEADLGSLGDTDLFHGQISIGRQFGHAEWAAGYDYYDIGGTSLGGVFTGLRFRF